MYENYEHLLFERPSPGVLLITMNRPERLNAANERMHRELSRRVARRRPPIPTPRSP